MTPLRKVSVGLGVFTVVATVIGGIISRPYAQMGSGYVAKQVCSCVYIGARDFEDCYNDLRGYVSMVDARPMPERSGVYAEVFPIARATAFYHSETGCTQE